MFIRSVKVPSSSGVVHEYVRVVESVRENGHVKQKVVLNLGRRDTLVTLLPLLQRFLLGDPAAHLEHDGPVQVLDASTWYPFGDPTLQTVLGSGPWKRRCSPCLDYPIPANSVIGWN
jgi:hypothetical protein